MRKLILLSIIAIVHLSCTNNESESEGKKLYQGFCVSCHGTNGGLRMAGAPDLTKSTLSSQEKMDFISMGSEDGVMQPFGKENGGPLSNDDIQKVVSYIESFE